MLGKDAVPCVPISSFAPGLEQKAWILNVSGITLALYLFMADSLRVAGHGAHALRTMLPQSFSWPLFCFALLLMAAPVLLVLKQIRTIEWFQVKFGQRKRPESCL